jgi:hypothetical protein
MLPVCDYVALNGRMNAELERTQQVAIIAN